MVAPLLDARGKLRYNIGAQVDVSGLVADCTDLDAFRRLVDAQEGKGPPEDEKDEFRELSEMFNHTELDTVRRYGGSMHRELLDEPDDASMHHRSRILLRDPGNGNGDISPVRLGKKPEGALSGVYQHVSCFLWCSYLLPTLIIVVPTYTAPSFVTHSLHFTIFASPWYSPVTILRPHRGLHSCPRFTRRSTCRRNPRRHSKNTLAFFAISTIRNGSNRRRSPTLDPLHTIAQPSRSRWCMDGHPSRRRQGSSRSAKTPTRTPCSQGDPTGQLFRPFPTS